MSLLSLSSDEDLDDDINETSNDREHLLRRVKELRTSNGHPQATTTTASSRTYALTNMAEAGAGNISLCVKLPCDVKGFKM